ncbi:Transcription-repair-coupling factor, partial [Haemophilus influenzae]
PFARHNIYNTMCF